MINQNGTRSWRSTYPSFQPAKKRVQQRTTNCTRPCVRSDEFWRGWVTISAIDVRVGLRWGGWRLGDTLSSISSWLEGDMLVGKKRQTSVLNLIIYLWTWQHVCMLSINLMRSTYSDVAGLRSAFRLPPAAKAIQSSYETVVSRESEWVPNQNFCLAGEIKDPFQFGLKDIRIWVTYIHLYINRPGSDSEWKTT